MCGIAGIVNLGRPVRYGDAIRRMTDRLIHRGPDAEGIYVDEHVSLGHRRLSIIDISEASNQPLWDHSGRYALIFNGEIYNYKELKQQLPDYPYKTQSDTEVVLAYYATYGTDCLQRFNGMFAFAIWDTVEMRLFAGRDRLGKKPFYYFQSEKYFVFASEIRSLLASGLIESGLEESNLAEYLFYQAPMDTRTLIRGVHQLRAGCFTLLEKGVRTEKSYWTYGALSAHEDDADTVRRKVKELFLDSVRLRMIADVPIGAFLSGGIDSGMVVACMAELSAQPVDTFTISFNEKEFDEAPYAALIAKKYNTRHHRITVRPEVFLESMDEILGAMDTPSGDGPNTYLVAKQTRKENIKVALSGLGGDELFAGYNKFLLFYKLMKYKWLLHVPGVLRQQVAKLLLNAGSDSKYNKVAALLHMPEWNLATVYPVLRRSYSNQDVMVLLRNPDKTDHVAEKLADLHKQIGWMGSLSKATVGEIETYTRDVLLRDTDQMAMAHALEVRVPFFDYRLVEYILAVGDLIKYPHTPKQLLVESLAPRLPPEIISRKKMGFTLPWEHWLKNEMSGMVQSKLNYLSDRPEFNGEFIQKKWNTFKKGDTKVKWPRIWKLVVLADWLERNKL